MKDVAVEIVRLANGADIDLPAYASRDASGMDLRAAQDATIAPGEWSLIATGIAIALPPGYEAQVRPRSGLAVKHGVTVLNAPGTIDADYRGEIKVPVINHGKQPFEVARGDRIAQLVIAPVSRAAWAERAKLDSTMRGAGGFGSTGKE